MGQFNRYYCEHALSAVVDPGEADQGRGTEGGRAPSSYIITRGGLMRKQQIEIGLHLANRLIES